MGEDKKPIVLSVVTEAAKLNPDTFEVLDHAPEMVKQLITQLAKELVGLQKENQELKKKLAKKANKNEDSFSF